MNRRLVVYLVLLTAVLTWTIYLYRQSQPPDEEQIARCNERVEDMPETTREEINRSINTFLECLEE
jgi:hypothetical protein